MLRFLTSLTFLYAFAITLLLAYGWIYYRNFIRNGLQRKLFPVVFPLIAIVCFVFLYVNIHAPLSLKTFSNLDHHFLRHDGFSVSGKIEIGRNDTINIRNANYNSFVLKKNSGQVSVHSTYSEEPLYIAPTGVYQLASRSFDAKGKSIVLQVPGYRIRINMKDERQFSLSVNDSMVCNLTRVVKKGTTAWNLFKDDPAFIDNPTFVNDRVVRSMKQLYLLRDNVSRESFGDMKFFLSGRIFQFALSIYHEGKAISLNDLAFDKSIPDKSLLAWGNGFLDNNRNQFRVQYAGADSFSLVNRYPVSYPLIDEERNNWEKHKVQKFLVSDSRDLRAMPAVFKQGYMFNPFDGDNSLDFQPVLLSYDHGSAVAPLHLSATYFSGSDSINLSGNKLVLPARAGNFSWIFSINDTFNWPFGPDTYSRGKWELLMFASLLIYFVCVWFTAIVRPATKQSWVWQVVSAVTLVLLTTRFFLYWRYKSFPPYEDMDLPSLQQLNSFWNFGVILFATVLLGIIFGFGGLRVLINVSRQSVSRILRKSYRPYREDEFDLTEDRINRRLGKFRLLTGNNARLVFFGAWLFVLFAGGAVAAINHFDPTVCRHLAIALVLFYFLFLYISYRYSPLVSSVEKSWWKISTGRLADIIMNNPVKILLSISLLALFAFVDIGFAIVFLNFLLFNEAFLCINYAIAGLSAGSKKNARLFGLIGSIYLLLFVINLVYGPYVFEVLLSMPRWLYVCGYAFFALLLAYIITRLVKKRFIFIASSAVIFLSAFLFFPKEKIISKAGITKYRIDVMTMPAADAIEIAYRDGKTYEPVIRAAQNQWFINTFIYEKNNPEVNTAGFNLLPHAPQQKGAKYNAQATDLVASRFFIAEHGKWSVLLYVLLLLLPGCLLASFYKLYPDFTNRINTEYPVLTTGFSLLNYLLITALLVILAATGRYIFFGQDMPFGSILSKQSILFPVILLVITVLLFRRIPLEQYPNRNKLIPGIILFSGLGLLLFIAKPAFNKDRQFGVADVARNMDTYIEARLQPLFDYFDTSSATRKFSIARKDRLFSDSLLAWVNSGYTNDAGAFFNHELNDYAHAAFSRHVDPSKLLFLDVSTGRPQLAVNDNYFRIQAPPHLKEAWQGNVYGDTGVYHLSWWNGHHYSMYTMDTRSGEVFNAPLEEELLVTSINQGKGTGLMLVNNSTTPVNVRNESGLAVTIQPGKNVKMNNPSRLNISGNNINGVLAIEPDAFMKNLYVNSNRFYVYPLGEDFIWARNFSESISSEYNGKDRQKKNAFVSIDGGLTDTLVAKIKMMMQDTAYGPGAEYGITVADGNGRLLAIADHIHDFERPDPNNKAAFNKLVNGNNGYVSQSLLRKQIGNINLLRMNPGPGSTLKPIVFSAIASQLNMDWDAFAAQGFDGKQEFFGGEKVGEYDFEKNNGSISSVVDYLKYSDNYYHSNLLLLGSYSRQSLTELLLAHFATSNPGNSFRWPYFRYKGKQYWLDGFSNWPGYTSGRANFGSDSSFVSTGLWSNYGIYTDRRGTAADRFATSYDSTLFGEAYRKSGFILPEYALFDQKGTGMDMRKPKEVFISSFRGHVKGSSQVMVPPVKMVDAFGKMISQNKNYSLTLNPYADESPFQAFDTGNGVAYDEYLSIIRGKLFEGLKQVLFNGGTAAGLGRLLSNGAPYYYYAKTGTTGDDDKKTKSKLFAIIISKNDVTAPGYNFRKNKFYTVYFTSQNGPAKQNEAFQAAVIKYIESTPAFKKYMAAD